MTSSSHRTPVSCIYYTDPYNPVGSSSDVSNINKLISKSHGLGLDRSLSPQGGRSGCSVDWPHTTAPNSLDTTCPSRLCWLEHVGPSRRFCSDPLHSSLNFIIPGWLARDLVKGKLDVRCQGKTIKKRWYENRGEADSPVPGQKTKG